VTARRGKVHIRPIPLALLAAVLLTTGCQRTETLGREAQAPAPARIAALAPSAPAVRQEPVVVTLAPPVPSAALALDAAIDRLGRRFPGDVGLAVRDVQTGWTSHHRGLDYFPQQSVSKLWVSLTALDEVDSGRLDLSRALTVTAKDLTLFHQPIRALALRPGGFQTTGDDLMVRALTQSDNSANDRLLHQIGGPDAVRATLRGKAIAGIRFGPGEPRLQATIAGLDWQPDWAGGTGFYTARDALPAKTRRAAFDEYLADPIDGATPIAMVDTLARLRRGDLLSPASTAKMTAIMEETRTGALRLKAGLKPGWRLAHKTGTGQVYQGEQAGYNDVGILTSPEGRSYAVAVMIGRTSRPLAERMKLMQSVVAATIAYDAALAAQRAAAPHEPNGSDPAPDGGPVTVAQDALQHLAVRAAR
jgi:beta-lactamase class A